MSQKETTIVQREITSSEKTKISRSHFIILPALLIPLFIIWVLSFVNTIPEPIKIAAYIIAFAVPLIVLKKQYTTHQEIKEGKVDVITGILEDKIKYGGSTKKRNEGLGRSPKKNKSSATYLLVINSKKYRVKPKIYSKAKIGKRTKLVYLPKSKHIISIASLD